MRRYLTLLTSLLVAIALPVSAGDLNAQLNQFFKARDAQHADGSRPADWSAGSDIDALCISSLMMATSVLP